MRHLTWRGGRHSLTKKFLKQQKTREFIRVVATDKLSFKLRFFNLSADDAEDE